MSEGLTWTVYDANTLTQREIYGLVLCELGEEHPEIVGLSADLAKSTKIGTFGDKFPDRFFNFGIAEQNMFGVAAGMAKEFHFAIKFDPGFNKMLLSVFRDNSFKFIFG